MSARFIGPMARLWVPTESSHSKVEVGTPVRREQKVFSGASNSLTAREQRRRKHQLLAPMDVKPRSLAHDLEHAALLLARPGSPERGLRFVDGTEWLPDGTSTKARRRRKCAVADGGQRGLVGSEEIDHGAVVGAELGGGSASGQGDLLLGSFSDLVVGGGDAVDGSEKVDRRESGAAVDADAAECVPVEGDGCAAPLKMRPRSRVEPNAENEPLPPPPSLASTRRASVSMRVAEHPPSWHSSADVFSQPSEPLWGAKRYGSGVRGEIEVQAALPALTSRLFRPINPATSTRPSRRLPPLQSSTLRMRTVRMWETKLAPGGMLVRF